MQQVLSMSRRSHHSLRLGALALLAAVAIWPRARGGMSAAELDSATTHRVGGAAAAHTIAARAETTAAKLVSPPRTAKLTVVQNDESQLSN